MKTYLQIFLPLLLLFVSNGVQAGCHTGSTGMGPRPTMAQDCPLLAIGDTTTPPVKSWYPPSYQSTDSRGEGDRLPCCEDRAMPLTLLLVSTNHGVLVQGAQSAPIRFRPQGFPGYRFAMVAAAPPPPLLYLRNCIFLI